MLKRINFHLCLVSNSNLFYMRILSSLFYILTLFVKPTELLDLMYSTPLSINIGIHTIFGIKEL